MYIKFTMRISTLMQHSIVAPLHSISVSFLWYFIKKPMSTCQSYTSWWHTRCKSSIVMHSVKSSSPFPVGFWTSIHTQVTSNGPSWIPAKFISLKVSILDVSFIWSKHGGGIWSRSLHSWRRKSLLRWRLVFWIFCVSMNESSRNDSFR